MKIVGSLGRLTARLRTGAGVLGFARKQTEVEGAGVRHGVLRATAAGRKLFAVALSVSTVLGGVIVGAAPAQAQSALQCVFSGATTQLNPIPPHTVYAPTPTGSTAPGTTPFTTNDPGTFAFNGTPVAPCAVAGPGGVNTNITSIVVNPSTYPQTFGDYQNVQCGTGSAYGEAVLLSNTTVVGTVNFTIVFAAGAGTLSTAADVFGVNYSDAGVVQITPTTVTACVTTDVNGFKVLGIDVGISA